MTAKPIALAEFLAWERAQELRYEFDGFQPVAMTGGTIAHSVIATNIVRALQDRLRGSSCRAFRGDLKILTAGRVRYPDAVVTCSPVANDADIVPEPVIVFEVLSASTASIDRITKNEEYRATPSIRRYVMLEQTTPAATVFSRRNRWHKLPFVLSSAARPLSRRTPCRHAMSCSPRTMRR